MFLQLVSHFRSSLLFDIIQNWREDIGVASEIEGTWINFCWSMLPIEVDEKKVICERDGSMQSDEEGRK